jgi:ABC-type transport system involved in Fe-S cluster assembly fused permease/ATPase subunit
VASNASNETKPDSSTSKVSKQAPGELPISSDEEAWSQLSSFGKYLWPSEGRLKVRVAGAVSLLVAAKLVNVQVPMLFKEIIDSMNVVTGGDVSTLSMALVASLLGYGIARSTASAFHELRSVVFSPVAQIAIRQVATQTFLHLHAMDLNWHLSRQTGGLSRAVDRGTRGIQQVLNAMLFTLVPTGLEIALVTSILGSSFGWKFAGLTMGTVGLYGLYTWMITRWRTRFRIEMNKLDSQAATVALDSLMNYETVKYFNNEKLEVGRYETVLKKYDVAQLKTTSSLALLNWGQNFVFSGALVAGMLMAAQGITTGAMTLGDVVLVNGLLLQLAMPLNFLGSTYRETRQALIDMSTMFKLLDLKSAIADSPNAQPLKINPGGGEITFQNVHFGYSDESFILKGASFTVPAGKKVAIVGQSGGGKSTLLRLLYRFYDADQGQINIDGQNLRDVSIDSLRRAIGVVPQDLVLFNESIFYNIQYGNPNATKEEVENAAKAANVHDAILRMPDGYETSVGERGLKLSGGEKQRVCLARALLKNPPILILDEATSSLDAESEAAVQVAIDNVVGGGRTVLMISHRLKTVHNADKIVVLDNGKIVEEGTHNSLMATRGHYFNLVQKQNLHSGSPAPIPAEESDVSL